MSNVANNLETKQKVLDCVTNKFKDTYSIAICAGFSKTTVLNYLNFLRLDDGLIERKAVKTATTNYYGHKNPNSKDVWRLKPTGENND